MIIIGRNRGMKLESYHSAEDKGIWKIIRTDDYTDVCPNSKGVWEIITADEASGECCVQFGEETPKTLSFACGIKLVRRRR
jgi:hypothetical protein